MSNKLNKFQVDKFKETHTKTHFNQTERQRRRGTLESNKREATHHIQGILNQIVSKFLIRNFGDQMY